MKKRTLNIKELKIHFLILAISLFMTLPVWGSYLTQLTTDTASDGHPYWSPDGTKIVFHSNRSGNDDVWVIDADGLSPPIQLTTHLNPDIRPHWSPDGTKIVFHRRMNGIHDIWVMSADGTNETQITSDPARDTHPNWGPDGTIAFQSNRSDSGTGDVNIWVMNDDGSDLRQITADSENNTHPMWSPDGTKIAFARRESETSPGDIWVMNADGTNETQITSDPGDEQHADWNPCGTSIAFRSNKAGNYDIWVVYLDDLAQNQITTYTGDDRNPDWSPDGNMMAFRSDRSGNNDIWIYNLPISVCIDIDIKPCSDPNSINLKAKGLVPVAVLTDDNFDAMNVDPGTVYFAGATPVKWTYEDVGYDCGEDDGDVDLLLFYKTQELNLGPDSTEAYLDGYTIDGVPIEGVDMVKIVH